MKIQIVMYGDDTKAVWGERVSVSFPSTVPKTRAVIRDRTLLHKYWYEYFTHKI